ncbi:MAG: hypothetical protein IPL95_12820 [Saprospiraceae bacterium]|nr:hypothetical protein [Saprospiraceae bacterium]
MCWIAFVPTQSSLEITVDVIGNCSAGNGVQALIHDNCATDPIDCDVACGGSPSVLGRSNLYPRKTYYLRIDGCSGAVCPIQITTFPANAIQNPNGPLIPELTILSGPSLISCPSENVYTYCANPFNDCATQFLWKIESGNAIITDTGEEL